MKKIASKKTLLKQACMLILGCLCCSVATNWILIPNGLTAPGITGISMTVEHFTGINYSVRGKVILQSQGKEFFTWHGKDFFT